jgi:hypothetical protein
VVRGPMQDNSDITISRLFSLGSNENALSIFAPSSSTPSITRNSPILEPGTGTVVSARSKALR